MLTETILVKVIVNVNSEASPTPKHLNGYAFLWENIWILFKFQHFLEPTELITN